MATRRRRSGKRTGKKSGCLIWLIPLSLGVILLLANRNVRDSLSRFVNDLGKGSGREQNGPRPNRNPEIINSIISRDMKKNEQRHLRTIRRQLEKNRGRDRRPETGGERKKKSAPDKKDTPLSFTATVYFVRYDAAKDRILLTPVRRKIRKTDTPAFTVLSELLKGPTRNETRRGLRTLIPSGTRVNRLHVRNGILHIDLTKNFIRGQKFGKEGLLLQIYQIVNSMSRFSTVRGVRFRINGKTLRTAGGDWVRLDRVFRRNTNPLA